MTMGSVERPWESFHVLSLAKLGCLPIFALWTQHVSSHDHVCTGSVTWLRDWSGDCLPKESHDPLGVRESHNLPMVTCSLRLGTESWVCNSVLLIAGQRGNKIPNCQCNHWLPRGTPHGHSTGPGPSLSNRAFSNPEPHNNYPSKCPICCP